MNATPSAAARFGADATRRGDPRRSGGEEGSTLLLTLLILSALSILASAVIVTAMGDRNLSRYERHSMQALGAAETGIAFAKRAIIDLEAPLEDIDGDGKPDFVLSDTLDWGGSYTVVAEASDIKGLGITAYQANGYVLVAEGRFVGATRRVKVEIVHDSFLKFARFVSATSLTYACGAALTGEVYTGGDLNIPCGCSRPCEFLESVYAVGDIPNSNCGAFHRGFITDAEEIDLGNSFSWTDVRNKARGLGADNSCERTGEVGIYMSIPGTDPLGLDAQVGADDRVLILDRFNFNNLTLAPGDTVISYGAAGVINTLTGAIMRKGEFNGIVFFEGTGLVRGTADGVSGRSMTIFSTTNATVRGDIVTGHTGFDAVTLNPDGSGDPVNLGLVSDSYVSIHSATKRVLRVDAALLSRTSNWVAAGTTASHPDAAPGPIDLDLDGINGESPFNHDPVPGQGWNELTITAATWVLNINGPIVTVTGGSAGPWADGSVIAAAAGPTRRYNYDLDMTEYPPPCFPVPLNLWKDVSWTEIFEAQSDLSSHLPE